MTTRTLHQNTVPPLSWRAIPDASGVVVGSYLYTYLPSAAAVGVRMYVPAGSPLLGTTATLMVFTTEVTDFYDIAYGALAPARAATVTLAVGWNQVTFAAAAIPVGQRFTIAASYSAAEAGVYVGSADPDPIQAGDGTQLWLSEWSTTPPVVDRSFIAHTRESGGQVELAVEWSFADHGLDVMLDDAYVPPDTAAPTITVTAQPQTATTARTATFTVTTSEAATTTYAVDNAAPVAFTGSFTLTGLSLGAHTVVIAATDTAGNAATPRSITWVVVSESGFTEGDLLVTPERVGRDLGRSTLTTAERDRIVDRIQDAQDDVAGYLRRPLKPSEVTLTRQRPRCSDVMSWQAWPFEDYDDEVAVKSATPDAYGTYTVVLTVGIDLAQYPEVARYVRAHAAELVRNDPDSGMGTRQVVSLSAEGQSISFDKAKSAGGEAGGLPTLESLAHLKRRSAAMVFKPDRAPSPPWPMTGMPVGWDPR